MPRDNLTHDDSGLILNAMESVCSFANDSLQRSRQTKHHEIALSNLFDHHGNAVSGTADKVVMMLANISRETAISSFAPSRGVGRDGGSIATPPPLFVNLEILFYANMDTGNYGNGLAAISQVISFFQNHPVFTRENMPELDPEIDKLQFEMVNLDPTDTKNLLEQFGARYLPMVMYKMRMLKFAATSVSDQIPQLD